MQYSIRGESFVDYCKFCIYRLYIEHGAVVDKFGGVLNSTPLHWATRQGHLSMVVFLMAAGADPTQVDGEGLLLNAARRFIGSVLMFWHYKFLVSMPAHFSPKYSLSSLPLII